MIFRYQEFRILIPKNTFLVSENIIFKLKKIKKENTIKNTKTALHRSQIDAIQYYFCRLSKSENKVRQVSLHSLYSSDT